jgi:hypothetical protein
MSMQSRSPPFSLFKTSPHATITDKQQARAVKARETSNSRRLEKRDMRRTAYGKNCTVCNRVRWRSDIADGRGKASGASHPSARRNMCKPPAFRTPHFRLAQPRLKCSEESGKTRGTRYLLCHSCCCCCCCCCCCIRCSKGTNWDHGDREAFATREKLSS